MEEFSKEENLGTNSTGESHPLYSLREAVNRFKSYWDKNKKK